ncbi:hypothetical protein BHE74_00054971 [Ensete ventricosum]|nr:hypothetical protein BHE74_00054971 [Ensete ventricosum]RZR87394.1 hypothetical protein BHM03_00014800 [Ensete ventricosum]
MIQSHLPVRLPCYDFTPVTSPAFGIPLLAVKVTTSGMTSSHSVTGSVYKARERIHRRVCRSFGRYGGSSSGVRPYVVESSSTVRWRLPRVRWMSGVH